MKIGIIGPAYPFRGGIATYNERLALEFQNQGHEVEIITFTLQYPSFLFPGKTQLVEGPGPKNLKISRLINSVNPFNWLKTGRIIRNKELDLIIVRYWLPFMGPALGTILRGIKKAEKTKVISLVDNMIPHESRLGDKVFTKYFVKPVDAFMTMSKQVLEDVNQFDFKKPKALSPHPIFDNFGDIEAREIAVSKLNWDPTFRYIMFFGLIRDYKGLDLLLKAFSDEKWERENIKLVIAGEYYSSKEKYQALIQKGNLSGRIIQIDKFIPDTEVKDLFNAVDLIVQPYKTATQSGVTQIAYHFNKPMIVTDVGGLSEMCPNGKVGFVVPTDPTDISNAILKFYKGNHAQEMITYIKEEKKKYSWEILVNNLLSLKHKLD